MDWGKEECDDPRSVENKTENRTQTRKKSINNYFFVFSWGVRKEALESNWEGKKVKVKTLLQKPG